MKNKTKTVWREALAFLAEINPGTRNINGQDVVVLTKTAYDKLVKILKGREVDY